MKKPYSPRRKRISPTQRSLKYLRDRGCLAQVVERWNPYAKVRQDLFGWIDIVALDPPARSIVAVQCTTTSNLAARIYRAEDLEGYLLWKECGGRGEFHGWAKRGERGKRKTWQITVR